MSVSKSGIASGLSPVPSAETLISSVTGPSEPWDAQTGSQNSLGVPVEKITEARTGSIPKIVEAESTSVNRKEETSQASVEHSPDATEQFCRHCGAAMERGSALCGDCGTHKIRPDRLKIVLSKLIDEAMADNFCTQCGAPVTEGKRLCLQCAQQTGELKLSETPGANTAPAPKLTSPEVKKAQTQLNSAGYDGLRGPVSSERRWTTSLTPADMLSIQNAIDLYEKKFPHQPSPSAEAALAWLASRRGHRGWRYGIASPVKTLTTLLRHDRRGAAASKPQLGAEESPRHPLWRRPVTLAGLAIVVVVAAAVISSFPIDHRQGSSVPSVTRDAPQHASLTTGRVAGEKPSAAVAGKSSSGRSAVSYPPFRHKDTSSVESRSITAEHDQAGVAHVAVPRSDSHADIETMLDGWAQAINNNDVTLEMRYYSDRLDRYFLARNVTQAFVAQDKARFYRNGNHILAYHIANVRVDQQSGQQAAVSLIKHWEMFHGLATKSGVTRSRLWLTRRGNQWTITGEQDLANLQPAPRGHVLRTSSNASF